MPVNAELLAALLAPIAGDNPSGKDLRYDPRYDKVKDARREDPDLPQRSALATERKLADWPKVVSLGTQLLSTETKDLQLGAWLTEALLKRDGFGGLATGLLFLHGLLEKFWDTFHPVADEDDLDLRTGPLDWVGTRLNVAVRQTAIAPDGVSFLDHQLAQSIPTEKEAESKNDKKTARTEALALGRRPPEDVQRAIEGATKAFYKPLVADLAAAAAALAALEQESDARFRDDAPSFGPLRTALEEVQRVAEAILAEKLAADPDPIVEEASEGDGVGTFAPPAGWSADGTPGGLPVEPTSAADAAARVASAARFLRQADPTSPAPYLMLRGLRWGELRATPGRAEPRLLEAPQTAARSRLKGLLLDGNWPELLEQGEALMATAHGRGWLDLQRYTLTACARLGTAYDAVAAAVRSELRALLDALPELPEMTLMDDTPTANPETQAWLAAEGLTGSPLADGSAESGEPAGTPTPDHTRVLADALAQDDATAASGGLARATPPRRATLGSLDGPPDGFALARAELRQGRPNRGIELLAAELSRARSPRARFVHQTQIAYVMVEAGLHSVARPILERLVAEIDERKLEDWEAGALIAQPMTLLCRVIDRLQDGGAAKQRNDLYLRVCRLDPLQALELTS